MSKPAKDNILETLSLGKAVEYKSEYDPGLLQPVPRSLNREQLGLSQPLPFHGVDIWNGYELSWLNSKGKPQVAIMRCWVPADSANIIESKAFKLYLNSFNQSRFRSETEVQQALQEDLSACAAAAVTVSLVTPRAFSSINVGEFDGECIDDIDISVDNYQLSADLLKLQNDVITSETLVSHLLKSNCLITDQPDWASVMIKYQGPGIDKESLLRYLISFRQHNEFHEQCVERIFCDIQRHCQPEKLTVYARYTRRGGLDINPFRSNFEAAPADLRHARQ